MCHQYHPHVPCGDHFHFESSKFIHVKVHPCNFISSIWLIHIAIYLIWSMNTNLYFYNQVSIWPTICVLNFKHVECDSFGFPFTKKVSSVWHISSIYGKLYICDQFHLWIEFSCIPYISFKHLFEILFQLCQEICFFNNFLMSFHPFFFFSPLVFLLSFSSSTLPFSSFPLPLAKPCITCSPRFQYNLECHYLSHIISPTFYSFAIEI